MFTPAAGAGGIARQLPDSILLALARDAMDPDTGSGDGAWPRLDLADPAQRRFGDYELLEELGRGGMGVVYRARQPRLDREVALKIIVPGIADTANVVRFLEEARAAARLVHPNIVPVYEVGSIDDVDYFSMPLIEGRSLGALLDAERASGSVVIALMLKLCEAMDYAHRLGLLHLDLKPSNILIDERGEPLIADFGLARHMDENGGVDAQEVSGTPAFMAPEQILIKQYRLTPATDTYALGAILYLCLTAVPPHGRGTADELIRRAAANRIPSPRELDATIARDLDAVCMKCLELQPADRYASVARLADDLRRVRDGHAVSVRAIGLFERTRRWIEREAKIAAALAFAVIALLLGVAGATWQWRQAESAKRQAIEQRDVAKQAERVAESARDRAAIASELGAFLFTHDRNAGDGQDPAHRLIAWLNQRLPGDESAQADVLTAFGNDVHGFDRRRFDELMSSVVEVLGSDYRKSVIAGLANSSNPRRHVHIAMLAWEDARPQGPTPAYRAAMDAALSLDPDDPFTLQVAALFNLPDAEVSLYPEAAPRLVRIAPDNMHHWLLLLTSAENADRTSTLREAARRVRYDDHSRDGLVEFEQEMELSGVSVSPLLARLLRTLSPGERPEVRMASMHAGIVPYTHWDRLSDFCNPANGHVTARSTRAGCLTIGTVMARSQAVALSRMTGVWIVRRLEQDTPLADEMFELRRELVYMRDQYFDLTPEQHRVTPYAVWRDDLRKFGELEASRRGFARLGLSTVPPPDWQAAHPNDLLPPEDRASAQ